MSTIEPTPPPASEPPPPSSPFGAHAGLVERVKGLLLTPSREWERIDGEPATIQSLYVGYVCILAAIPAIASLIGSTVFGHGAMGITYRPSIMTSLGAAVTTYVLSLLSVAVTALIIEFLAPTFGGTKDRLQAFKVAAYFPTAAWVAGVFNLIPMLTIVGVIGALYSLYLLYQGLPRLMRTPQDKALPYTAVVIIAAVVLYTIIGAIAGSMTAAGARIGNPMAVGSTDRGSVSGTLTIPGVGNVDLGQVERATQRAEAMQNARPVASGALQGLLPGSIGGMPRTQASSTGTSVGGMGAATATGVYTRGDARISLTVADMAGAGGAMMGMAGALNIQHEEQNGTRYERVRTVDGRMTTESYDSAARSGQYAVVVGDRFAITAEGSGVGMGDLQGAVRAVDLRRLEGLARG